MRCFPSESSMDCMIHLYLRISEVKLNMILRLLIYMDGSAISQPCQVDRGQLSSCSNPLQLVGVFKSSFALFSLEPAP